MTFKKLICLLFVIATIVYLSFFLNGNVKNSSSYIKNSYSEITDAPAQLLTDNMLSYESIQTKEAFPIDKHITNNTSIDSTNPSNTKLTHLDNLLEEDHNSVTLDSTTIESLSLNETRILITNLESKLYKPESQELLIALQEIAYKDLSEMEGMNLESISCSDNLCGVIFSGNKMKSVIDALNNLSQSSDMSSKIKGGTLRVIEDNEEFYGVIIASIGAKPITLK
ncbi:hypothetical protein [Thalassotalea agarivorans]|uniref:Uncharacterized protein n=1 Tax=Thalassotalea agarivorans TaxID=349064 RepID=A0A1I0CEH7_THASX|nr:hypothetical protein [Thalassotalea agarivorans]SET17970.1 hypothetical protein SAMN05660429_01173 [Thalassotalea agarivorans]